MLFHKTMVFSLCPKCFFSTKYSRWITKKDWLTWLTFIMLQMTSTNAEPYNSTYLDIQPGRNQVKSSHSVTTQDLYPSTERLGIPPKSILDVFLPYRSGQHCDQCVALFSTTSLLPSIANSICNGNQWIDSETCSISTNSNDRIKFLANAAVV